MSEQAPQRRLELVHEAPAIPGFDWEITAENVQVLVARIAELEQLRLSAENRLRGSDLQIAQLRADREAAAKAMPDRPVVELVHACWKVGCHRQRPLKADDREALSRALAHFGLDFCLRAVAGAAHDPSFGKPNRNGRRERYDDLELVFRSYAKVAQFARRAPVSWQAKPERIAKLIDGGAEWVERQLTPTEKQRDRVAKELADDA